LTFNSIGVSAIRESIKPARLIKSEPYYDWENKFLWSNEATSIPRKERRSLRSFMSKQIFLNSINTLRVISCNNHIINIKQQNNAFTRRHICKHSCIIYSSKKSQTQQSSAVFFKPCGACLRPYKVLALWYFSLMMDTH